MVVTISIAMGQLIYVAMKSLPKMQGYKDTALLTLISVWPAIEMAAFSTPLRALITIQRKPTPASRFTNLKMTLASKRSP